MRVDLFRFRSSRRRIALRPARPRDSARLLLVEGGGDRGPQVLDLPDLLRPGDVLVFNDTKVIPAQLEGAARRGASIGATLHKREGPREWRAFLRNAKRARIGDRIDFGEGVARFGGREGGRRSALAAFPRRGAGRVAARARRADAAAALYRRQRPRRRGATATTIRRCSRARKARSPPRPPRSISRRG